MFVVNLLTGHPYTVNNSRAISFSSHLNPSPLPQPSRPCGPHPFEIRRPAAVRSGIRQIRERIEIVEKTQKVTEAMKLVATAKVRRAQEAVVNGRPFAETLINALLDINEQCRLDGVEIPLTAVRPVRRVALIVLTGDRGLCGGFNRAIIHKAESRISELNSFGHECTLISVGKRGNEHFKRKPDVKVDGFIEGDSFLPTSKEAQDPAQILDALMPLYMNSQILRALHESYARELASRMNSMTNATDNAVELKKSLMVAYNRERQTKITAEILEIVAGAEAMR